MSGDAGAGERSNNLVAITIALLAAFVAVTSIKGSNVAQAMEAANAERNTGEYHTPRPLTRRQCGRAIHPSPRSSVPRR